MTDIQNASAYIVQNGKAYKVVDINSWDDLTDKPFYDNYVEETFTTTFDGDKTGKIVFENAGSSYVWVSEKTIEDISSIVNSSAIGMMEGVEDSIDIPNSMWEDISYALNGVPAIGAVYDPTNAICIAVSLNQAFGTYPAGIYVLANDGIYITSFTCTIGQGDIKRLDPKFLPEGIGYEESYTSEISIEWDGDPTGKPSVDAGGGALAVKISDNTPSMSEVLGGQVIIDGESMSITEDMIYDASAEGFHAIVVYEGIFIFYEAAPVLGFNEAGTYVISLMSSFTFTYNGTTTNIKKIDKKFLPEHSWNNLEDRPFYDESYTGEISYEFDGDLNGKVVINNDSGYLIKMSNYAPTMEELQTATGTFYDINTGVPKEATPEVIDMSSLIDTEIYVFSHKYSIGEGAFDNRLLAYSLPAASPVLGLSAGLWFVYSASYYAQSMTYTGTVGEMKKLDPKYLPEGIGYEEVLETNTLIYDGVPTSVKMSSYDPDEDYAKVSDCTPSVEQLLGGVLTINIPDVLNESVAYNSDNVIYNNTYNYIHADGIYVALEDNIVLPDHPESGYPVLSFPEKGIYLPYFKGVTDAEIKLTLPNFKFPPETIVHKIDPKFLPDSHGSQIQIITWEEND